MSIIEEIYTSEIFNEIINKYSHPNYIDDAKQEIILILIDLGDEKLKEIKEKKYLTFFIIRIIKNQLASATSPFYTKYRKHRFDEKDLEYLIDESDDDIGEKIEFEENLEKLDTFLDQLHWYDRTLWELKYKEDNSYNQLVEMTKIPRISLWTSITQTTNHIKKNFN